jgi:hypothetical protein
MWVAVHEAAAGSGASPVREPARRRYARRIDHYQRLGVGPTASADEIRAAYRTLARQLHPDTQGGTASPEMAAVNEAWRVLSDPGRRALYDAQRRGPGSGGASTGARLDEDLDDGADALDLDDLDDLDVELSPAEVRASRRWALIFGFTAVAVTLLLLVMFAYAFIRSPVVTSPGGPQP